MAEDGDARLDPRRTLASLWGTRTLPRRGPKHGLSIDQVVVRAIELADADGDLVRLSMRRVGEALGVGTMSLYTYVATRDELLALMLDRVYGEVVRALGDDSTGDWTTDVRAVAASNWDLALRHPWVLQVATGRPALGPNAIAKYDRELSSLEDLGLSDVEMDSALTLVLAHVAGVARTRIEQEQVAQRTGVSDQQWWELVGPAFAEHFDPARFPLADRVGRAAGEATQAAYDPGVAYAFGMDRILDGIAALIESRR